MSKNTGASKFRRVDVDQFDPDKFNEDVIEDEEQQGPNESAVQTLITQGKNADALLEVLSKAPVGTKNQAVKDRAVQLAIRVLTSFKSSEIEAAVKKIDQSDSRLLDILMKYVYRGFEFPEDGSSASLLTWHEKVFASGGAGCIIRVLTDRKRV